MAEMDQGLKWLIEKRRDDLIALTMPDKEHQIRGGGVRPMMVWPR